MASEVNRKLIGLQYKKATQNARKRDPDEEEENEIGNVNREKSLLLDALRKYYFDYVCIPVTEQKRAKLIVEGIKQVFEEYIKSSDYFSGNIHHQGSSYEGLKVIKPDDFDLLISLKMSNDGSWEAVEANGVNGCTAPGYYFINKKTSGATTFDSCIVNGCINPIFMFRKMQALLHGAINKMKWMFSGIRIELSQTGPEMTLNVMYNGGKKMFVNIFPCIELAEIIYVAKRHPLAVEQNFLLTLGQNMLDQLWRRSYTRKEQIIVREMDWQNECRRTCLKILKTICVRRGNSPLGILSSYHLKTCMLHLNDDIYIGSWHQDNLHHRFKDLLKKLMKFLVDRNLPNFFNPRENLFVQYSEISLGNILGWLRTTLQETDQKIIQVLLYEDYCQDVDKNTQSFSKIKQTTSVKELKEKNIISLIPEEILARGTKAIQSYMDEINNGEITMVNSRIMVLGKEGTGKTSTVNRILGKRLNEDEPSTDGIVTTIVVQNVGKDCSTWDEHEVDICELTKEIHDYAIAENVAKKLNTNENQQSISEKSKSLEASATIHPLQISSTVSAAASMKKQGQAVSPKKKDQECYTKPKRPETGDTERTETPEIVSATSSDTKRIKSPDPLSPTNEDIGTMKTPDPVSPTTENTETVVSKKIFDDITIPDNVKQKLVNILLSGTTENCPKDITSIWDYAGQLIYYLSHRFYLTRKCVYCVVFSLFDKLNDMAKPRHGLPANLEVTNLEMVVFFVRSIYEHTVLKHGSETRQLRKGKIAFPPIVLVGTHKDKLKGSEAEKLKEIENLFSIIIEEIQKMPYRIHEHIDREIYAINNRNPSDEGIQKLMKTTGTFMNDMVQTVPICWVNFQSKLQEAARTKLRMSLVEVTNLAIECGISVESLTTVLDYLSDVGVILYSKKNKKLKDTVIINLHEMNGIMKTIITFIKAMDIGPALEDSWKRLDNEGILEEKLLCHLWEEKIKEDASNLEVFLEVMKMFGLLFEKGNEHGKRIFLVPCRMKITTKSLEIKKDDRHTASIYVTPTDFLPDAVNSVLVIGLLELMAKKGRNTESKCVKLFQNCSDFDLYEDHHVRLGAVKILNKRALKLEISHIPTVDEDGKEENFEPQHTTCMEVLTYVREQLETVYGTMEGVGYELRVFCDACDAIDKSLHKLDQCLENKFIRCGDKAMSTARFRRLFAEHEKEKSEATKSQVKTDISHKDFQKMLLKVSKWYDDNCDNIMDTLIVLYKDIVTPVANLEAAKTTIDLFELLKTAGHLTLTNYDILLDTANLTGTQGVLSSHELLSNACRTSDKTVFTTYRKNLMAFGNKLMQDQIKTLASVTGVPGRERHNQWTVILNLEKKGEICENNLQTFIELLKDCGLSEAAKELEVVDEDSTDFATAVKAAERVDGATPKLTATNAVVNAAEEVEESEVEVTKTAAGKTTESVEGAVAKVVAAKKAVESAKTVVAEAMKKAKGVEREKTKDINRAAEQTVEKVEELEQLLSALKH